MASDVEICSQALGHIGKGAIQSFDQKGAEAEACSLHFRPALDSALASFDWNFASRTIYPPAITIARIRSPYQAAFTYPADCLKVREITRDFPGEPDEYLRFDVESNQAGGKLILAIKAAPGLRYTSRDVDVSNFDAAFVEFFSFWLAFRLAMPLTRDLKVRNEMYRIVRDFRAPAEALSANEGTETRNEDPEWITARG
jgi:hypothetical protein